MISDKGVNAIQWNKDSLFTNGAAQIESRHRPSSFTKIDSKWIIDLNIKCKTIKFLEGNTGENLMTLGVAVISFTTLEVQPVKNISLTLLNLKTFALQKTSSREIEDSQTGRKYLQKTYLIKDCYQNIHKTLEIQQ